MFICPYECCIVFMRLIFYILFLSLILVQAMPVLQLFSSQREVFYLQIDEEESNVKSEGKKEIKDFFSYILPHPTTQRNTSHNVNLVVNHNYRSPIVELSSPPPDHC
jgi:hypothetical protein